MLLETLSLALAAAHFGTPLAYYTYMKRYLKVPWNISLDSEHRPRVTVIVPAYQEEQLIEQRLNNLYQQDYDKDLIQVIVVDDRSEDRTSERAGKWIREHQDFDVQLIRQNVHQGKLYGVHAAMRHANPMSEILILTDTDAFWKQDALSNLAKYFADSSVGSVTCSIAYGSDTTRFGERIYRDYYNILRVAESKKHSTPIQNGPLLAIRMKILQRADFPNYGGSDDSVFGSFIAFTGYRAIQADDVFVTEPERGNHFRRKIRRANRLLQNFRNTKRYATSLGVRVPSPFDTIWKVEWWLHVANPWLLLTSLGLLGFSALVYSSAVALVIAVAGLLLLFVKSYRMWVAQQFYLMIGRARGFRTKDVIWTR